MKKPPIDNLTRIGKLVILSALAHEHRGLSKSQWWYQVQCDCGTVEEVNHTQLKKRWACQDCMQDSKGMAVSEARRRDKNKLPPGVPDFARMKLV